MLQRLVGLLQDERGSAFIENALWIVIVVMIVAVAGLALARQGITPALDNIQATMGDAVDLIPDLKD